MLSDRALNAVAGAGYAGGRVAADAPFLISGYERGEDLEADGVGLVYARQAGCDPQACVRWLERLDGLERAYGVDVPGGWQSHPPSPDRADALRALLAADAGGLRAAPP